MSAKILRLLAAVLILTALPLATLAADKPAKEQRSTTAKPVAPEPPSAADSSEPAESAEDKGSRNDRVGVGDDIDIPAGTKHEGDVVCIQGHATIDGEVDGDVVVVAGKLTLNGVINGDVALVASRAELGDHAVIDGGLTNVGGSLHRGASTVHGQVVNISPFNLDLPSFGGDWDLFGSVFGWWRIFSLFLFFVAAILMAALVPERVRLISEETPVRLFTAFLVGLLGYVLLVLTQCVLFVTLVGWPLIPFVYFVFIILKWMAMCGVFHYVGTRVGRTFGREMSLLGGILLGLLPFALIRLVPVFCVGYFVWFVVEVVAFGFLIITRVGTRRVAGHAAPPVPVAPATS